MSFSGHEEAWREWHDDAHEIAEIDGVGVVEHWGELTDVSLPFVTFRWTIVFPDGEVLTSDSTLRFREREEVEAFLAALRESSLRHYIHEEKLSPVPRDLAATGFHIGH